MVSSSQDQYAEEENPSNFQYTRVQDTQPRRRSKHMPSLRPTNTLLSRNLSLDTYELIARNNPVYDSETDKMISCHGIEGMAPNSYTTRHTSPSNSKSISYRRKSIGEGTEHCLYKSDVTGNRAVQRTNDIKSRHSGTALNCSGSPDNEVRGSPKMMNYMQKVRFIGYFLAKGYLSCHYIYICENDILFAYIQEAKPYGERKIKESYDQARVRIHSSLACCQLLAHILK